MQSGRAFSATSGHAVIGSAGNPKTIMSIKHASKNGPEAVFLNQTMVGRILSMAGKVLAVLKSRQWVPIE